MQRQKTIAKWLAIVLLCTVAVGAYIMYDALYVGDGGQASAGGGTEGMPDPEPLPEPDPPYYTQLPRPAETVNGVSVRHAGGEKDDELQSTVFTADGALAFFRSGSYEFDCRGVGLYCAVFDGGGLSSVNKFSDGADSCVLAAKRTAEGVTTVTSDSESGRIYVFGDDGTVKAETEFPRCESVYIHTGAQTSVFYADGESLRRAVIDRALRVQNDSFVLYEKNCEIMQAAAVGDRFIMVAQCGSSVKIISFAPEKGFEVLNSIDKAQFLQFVPVAGEDGVLFALLCGRADGLLLATFGADGAERDCVLLPDRYAGALFGDGTSLTLVCEGVTETYCRHLDKITSSNNILSFEKIYFARAYGGAYIFAADCGGMLTLCRASADGSAETVFTQQDTEPDFVASAMTDGKLSLAFSSGSDENLCYQNFGERDVFLFSVAV